MTRYKYPVVEVAAKLRRKLLKKPQTLTELSVKTGVPVKALTRPISDLVHGGEAVRIHGRPPRYRKWS